MIEKPKIGETYQYCPNHGTPKLVRAVGFRGLSWVITQGVEDGQRRDVSRKRLEH